jgi:vacuolar-type H+-ATPase subunit I/STV1
MKNRSISLGILLILTGIVWVMINAGYIAEWSIRGSISVLWPLLLVMLGLNILIRKSPLISVIIWIVFAAIIIGYSLHLQEHRDLTPRDGESVIVENMGLLWKNKLS